MIVKDEQLNHIATDVNYEGNKWGAVDGALWHIGNKWDDWGEDYWDSL